MNATNKLTTGMYESSGNLFEITRRTDKTAWVSSNGTGRPVQRRIKTDSTNEYVTWDEYRSIFPSMKQGTYVGEYNFDKL